jgi:hypothetical protein
VGLLNLAAQLRWIITRIPNIHMDVVTEPWHVYREDFRPRFRSLQILLQGVVHAGRGTSAARQEAHNRQN